MTFQELEPKVIDILHHSNQLLEDRLLEVCHLLLDNVDYYDWVGFYFKNGDKPELKLSSYAGEPTDHTIIPFGRGICGQVALTNKNFVADDVSAEANYLSCNMDVKSEIVVPIFVNGENVGQIDIDSNVIAAFNELDEQFLEAIAKDVAKILEK